MNTKITSLLWLAHSCVTYETCACVCVYVLYLSHVMIKIPASSACLLILHILRTYMCVYMQMSIKMLLWLKLYVCEGRRELSGKMSNLNEVKILRNFKRNVFSHKQKNWCLTNDTRSHRFLLLSHLITIHSRRHLLILTFY